MMLTNGRTLFKRAGAKYIVLTTKHHEGFALWPSKKLPNHTEDPGIVWKSARIVIWLENM